MDAPGQAVKVWVGWEFFGLWAVTLEDDAIWHVRRSLLY